MVNIERNGLGATNILTVPPPSTTCDHQEALEYSGQKSDCLLVGFSLFKPSLLSAASSVGVESITNRFSLIQHRGTCIFSSCSSKSAILFEF